MIKNEIFEVDHKYFGRGQEEFEIFANAVLIKPLCLCYLGENGYFWSNY